MDERERREKLQRLVKLDKIYIDMMYFRFLDESVPDIAELLKIPPKTAYTRFTRIFELLGITGENKEQTLIQEYSPILLEFVKSKEDLDNWGHIRADMIRQLSEPGTPVDEPIQTTAAPESEVQIPNFDNTENRAVPVATPPSSGQEERSESVGPTQKASAPRSNLPWFIVGGLILAGCVLCVFAGLYLRQFIPGFRPAQTPTIPIPPNTTSPSITSPVPTETLLPTLTDTPLPNTPTDTPTNTALPTASFTPSMSPLFLDDFNNGMSPKWQLVSGSAPIIVNGSLTFTDNTRMIIDAKDWTDYEVSFYVSNMSCQEHVDSRGLTVGLRVQDANNMVALRINDQDYCGGTWVQIQNNNWNKLPNTNFKLPPVDSNGGRQITLRVQGNTYSTPIGTSVVIQNYPSGGVALIGAKGVTIDNFKVVPLSP